MAIRDKKVTVLTVGKQNGYIYGTFEETREKGTITCIQFKMENGATTTKRLFTEKAQDIFFEQLAKQLNMLDYTELEIYEKAVTDRLPITCYVYDTYDENGEKYATPTLDVFESKGYKEWLLTV